MASAHLIQVKAIQASLDKTQQSFCNGRPFVSDYHAVIWLDHAEASIFSFNPKKVDTTRLLAQPAHRQVHHKSGALGTGKVEEDREFYREISIAIDPSGKILIVGAWNCEAGMGPLSASARSGAGAEDCRFRDRGPSN